MSLPGQCGRLLLGTLVVTDYEVADVSTQDGTLKHFHTPKSANELACFWVFQDNCQRASSRIADCGFVELDQRRPHFLERLRWRAVSKFELRRH